MENKSRCAVPVRFPGIPGSFHTASAGRITRMLNWRWDARISPHRLAVRGAILANTDRITSNGYNFTGSFISAAVRAFGRS